MIYESEIDLVSIVEVVIIIIIVIIIIKRQLHGTNKGPLVCRTDSFTWINLQRLTYKNAV